MSNYLDLIISWLDDLFDTAVWMQYCSGKMSPRHRQAYTDRHRANVSSSVALFFLFFFPKCWWHFMQEDCDKSWQYLPSCCSSSLLPLATICHAGGVWVANMGENNTYIYFWCEGIWFCINWEEKRWGLFLLSAQLQMCKFEVQLLSFLLKEKSVFKRETQRKQNEDAKREKGLREWWRQMSGREREVKSAQSEKAQGRWKGEWDLFSPVNST